MLTTLLESKSRGVRDNRGTAASVTLHALIIFAAIYATASGAPMRETRVNLTRLHWVPIPPPVELPKGPLTSRTSVERFVVRVPTPVNIPTTIPPIEIPSPSLSSEFSPGTSGITRPSESSGSAAGDERRAYDASEVESGVTVIGNVVPEYPSALRSSGIEGSVVAEFVVTENGRVDLASLRILSSTNDAFVDSIRRALSRMRFRPAMIGEHPVAQLVQQQFVFRLD